MPPGKPNLLPGTLQNKFADPSPISLERKEIRTQFSKPPSWMGLFLWA